MRFLRKKADCPESLKGLTYEGDAVAILQILQELQFQFCAYSERYFSPTDFAHVEHFDPRLKPTNQDGYKNWYAVHGKINIRRAKKIERFLPLPDPSDETIIHRIKYTGIFEPVDPQDLEIVNLLDFIRANDPLIIEHRKNHIAKIINLLESMTREALLEHMKKFPVELSFPTALQYFIGIPAFDLIEEINASKQGQ